MMERYADQFIRECSREEEESESDYLDRFLEWMLEQGLVEWMD